MRRSLHPHAPPRHASHDELEAVLLHPSAAMRPGGAAAASPELIQHLQRAGNAAVAAHLAAAVHSHPSPLTVQRKGSDDESSEDELTKPRPKRRKTNHDEAFDPEELPPEPYEPDEYDRAEGFGNSSRLAANRFNLKRQKPRTDKSGTPVKFADWKKGYEAQHIIPGAIFRDLILADDLSNEQLVNESWNGMMLPSGRPEYEGTIVYKAKGKGTTLPRHINPAAGLAHPTYNATVRKLTDAVARRHAIKKWTLDWLKGVADYLRRATKALTGQHAVDDLANLRPGDVTPQP